MYTWYIPVGRIARRWFCFLPILEETTAWTSSYSMYILLTYNMRVCTLPLVREKVGTINKCLGLVLYFCTVCDNHFSRTSRKLRKNNPDPGARTSHVRTSPLVTPGIESRGRHCGPHVRICSSYHTATYTTSNSAIRPHPTRTHKDLIPLTRC